MERSLTDIEDVEGNISELRETFTNLILNAVDAMPQGGNVDLRCFVRNGMVRVEVEDGGVGMTEEIRRHLFDPFYTTKGQSGTGLGMSVAYGIITRHDGTVDVETTLEDRGQDAEEPGAVWVDGEDRRVVVDTEHPGAGDLPQPFNGCGFDPSADDLPTCNFPADKCP